MVVTAIGDDYPTVVYLGIILDITQYKAAEIALGVSQHLARGAERLAQVYD